MGSFLVIPHSVRLELRVVAEDRKTEPDATGPIDFVVKQEHGETDPSQNTSIPKRFVCLAHPSCGLSIDGGALFL